MQGSAIRVGKTSERMLSRTRHETRTPEQLPEELGDMLVMLSESLSWTITTVPLAAGLREETRDHADFEAGKVAFDTAIETMFDQAAFAAPCSTFVAFEDARVGGTLTFADCSTRWLNRTGVGGDAFVDIFRSTGRWAWSGTWFDWMGNMTFVVGGYCPDEDPLSLCDCDSPYCGRAVEPAFFEVTASIPGGTSYRAGGGVQALDRDIVFDGELSTEARDEYYVSTEAGQPLVWEQDDCHPSRGELVLVRLDGPGIGNAWITFSADTVMRGAVAVEPVDGEPFEQLLLDPCP